MSILIYTKMDIIKWYCNDKKRMMIRCRSFTDDCKKFATIVTLALSKKGILLINKIGMRDINL